MKIYSIIFLIFLISSNIFSTEQIIISTSSINSGIENYETPPLYYKFYYTPDFFGAPSVDYEDLSVPYLHYITPELNKDKIENVLFVSAKDLLKKSLYFTIGANYVLNTDIKFVSPYYNLSFFLGFDSFKTNYLNSIENLKKFRYSLRYYKPFNNLSVDFQLGNRINYFIEFLNLYTAHFNIKKFINGKFEISYSNDVLYIKSTSDKIFSFNEINANALINTKLLMSSKFKLIDNDRLIYAINLASKEILPRFSSNIEIDYDSLSKDIFYTLYFSKQVVDFYFNVSYVNDIYYDYIQNYFLKVPIFQLNNNGDFYYPKRKVLGFYTGYQKNFLNLKLSVEHSDFQKYPTYIYKNNNILPFYLEFLNFYNLSFNIGLNFQNINVSLENNLIFSNEEILFSPKIGSSLDIFLNIYKNIYLSIKLLYNSKVKVDFNQTYIEPNLVLDTMVKYEIVDDLKLCFGLNSPLVGKHYFVPYAFFEPYISCGIEMRF